MRSVSGVDRVLRRAAEPQESARAMRRWWDAQASDYYAEHGAFLGDADFVWGPENLREDAARLLGDVDGLQVLEVGCGGGQCSRWLLAHGARPVGFDISGAQLSEAVRLGRRTGLVLPFVQADAQQLP